MDVPTLVRPRSATAAPADIDHEIFVRNLIALYRKDPQLAQRIDEVPDEDRLSIEAARSGAWTACVSTSSGKTYLHSRYDPQKEAAKFAESVEIDGRFCFVVCGMGLGHHVIALYGRLKGDAVIVVAEPSIETLSTAFAVTDFSELIREDKLVILDRLDKSCMHEKLQPHNSLMMLGAQIVVHAPSRAVAGAFQAEAAKMITDLIAYSRMTLLTLVGNAAVTCQNIAYNLPDCLRTPPIDILRNKFAGRPCVIVAAGPSLRKNVDLLHEAKGKAVIIAVQTTFKPLLERGIVPDFVTSLDFHSVSRQFFGGIEDFHDVHLVAEPKVTWHVLDQFKGPVSLLHSAFASDLIGEKLAKRDGLQAGATVAHLAFYLARYMGCDPIIFIGQDLAFTNHCFYVPGVEAHKTWQSETNRFVSIETKEWERIVRNRSILRKVEGIDERTAYTDDLLFTYLEQFERDFIGTSARIIDATEGGARMRGSDVMPLREAVDRFCVEPLPADAFDYRKTCNWNDTSRFAAARAEIESRIGEVEHIHDLCEQMNEALTELEGLIDQPVIFNRKIVHVDDLRTRIQRCHRAIRIVNASSQLAELQRFTADRKLSASNAKGAQLARSQLARDKRFVESFSEASQRMGEYLRDTLKRFDLRSQGKTQ